MKKWMRLKRLGVLSIVAGMGACVIPEDDSSPDDVGGGQTQTEKQDQLAVKGTVHAKNAEGAVTALQGATVTVAELSKSASTDADGRFSIALANDSVEQLTVTFHAHGYAEAVRTVILSERGNARLEVALKALSPPRTVTLPGPGENPVLVDVGSMSLTLEPGDLAFPDGTIAAGDVQVDMLEYHAINDIGAFPADLFGTDAAGNVLGMRTYGMLRVEVTQNGQKLNVAEGQDVLWRVEVDASLVETAVDLPPSLLSLDFSNSLWILEEEATFNAETKVIEGNVSHFSYWNVDYWFCIEGSNNSGSTDDLCDGGTVKENVTCVDVVPIVKPGQPFPLENVSITVTDGVPAGGGCYNYGCPVAGEASQTRPLSEVTYTVTTALNGEQVKEEVTYQPRCGLDIGGCDFNQCDKVTVTICLGDGALCKDSPEFCCGGYECKDGICVPAYDQQSVE